MHVSSFCFAIENLDIAEIKTPWPEWLSRIANELAVRKGWSDTWFSDAVTSHFAQLARPERDRVAVGTFPRRGEPGLVISVPSTRYMLALKLKALRISDAGDATDICDIANLISELGISEIELAIEILTEFFPKTGRDADKQRFVLKRMLSKE